MALIPYTAPSWCRNLKSVPQAMIALALKPTPVEAWKLPDLPTPYKVSIKRDDLTGSTHGGNKIRKLEFLLAEALRQDCKHVITCGSLQSNHCRAVASVCAQLGLTSHLFCRYDSQSFGDVRVDGNLLLDGLFGSRVHLIPKKAQYKTDIKPEMEKLAEQLRRQRGENSYLIPVGGSDVTGLFGYIEAFREIHEQVKDTIDDIICVCGSGGTAAGLAIANYLNSSPYRIHGITVCDSKAYFLRHTDEMLADLGIEDVRADDILTIHDGYKGLGYGISQPQELDVIHNISRSTGVVLDTVYTAKAAYGMLDLMKSSPPPYTTGSAFKGHRIMFLHSGGVFSIFSERTQSLLLQQMKADKDCPDWLKQTK